MLALLAAALCAPCALARSDVRAAAASRALLQDQQAQSGLTSTSIYMIDLSTLPSPTSANQYDPGEYALQGQVNISAPTSQGLAGSYALTSEAAKQMVEVIQAEVVRPRSRSLPRARARGTPRQPSDGLQARPGCMQALLLVHASTYVLSIRLSIRRDLGEVSRCRGLCTGAQTGQSVSCPDWQAHTPRPPRACHASAKDYVSFHSQW
jgi:hypothetical protein